jgi:transcriptional regulator with XRE-family HTH domain
LKGGNVRSKTELNVGVPAIVGRQVRSLRKAAGLTQAEAADRCDIFRTYLSRIENGTANLTLSVLLTLATTLGVKVTDLLVE